jgi:hypothetical protein
MGWRSVCILYKIARRCAWRCSVPYAEDHPRVLDPKWGLYTTSPGHDARGIYQLITHTPIYVFKMLYATLRFPYENIRWKMRPAPTDQEVFDLCTQTSLVMIGEFLDDQTFVLNAGKWKIPQFVHVCGCDPSTLKIKFDVPSRTILVATTNSEEYPVGSGEKLHVTRNEILICALRNILSLWLHATIHVGAERNAMEIQHMKIAELEPSCHFTSSLHEGLLHGTWSPLSRTRPFFGGMPGTQEQMVEDCFNFPVPPHVIDNRKMQFELYHFAIKGREAVFVWWAKKIPPERRITFFRISAFEGPKFGENARVQVGNFLVWCGNL